MIRGLSFEMPNEYGSYLNTIFSGISLEKYVWMVSEDDAFTNSENYLFNSDIFTGKTFGEIIAPPSYYVFFANIQAYMREDDFCEIDTYADFLRSKCELIIL